jgi:uncharacterized phage protein (TIGR02220 family)
MYGKIFSDIFDSSLVMHGGDVVYVFIALIVLADSEGFTRITIPALAARIGKDVETVAKAVAILESPDPYSSSADEHGARIKSLREITGGTENRGWWIVNYRKYREIARRMERAEKSKDRVQRWRKRNADETPSNDLLRNATPGEGEGKGEVKTTLSRSPRDSYVSQAIEVLDFLNAKTKRVYRALDGRGQPTTNLRIIIDRLKSGVTVQDCKTVIARKHRDWATDDKMRQYLRPSTLFRASNFEQYLGECV